MGDQYGQFAKTAHHAHFTLCGTATISAGSAVSAQVPAAGVFWTVTKPAGTGIYRLTFAKPWGNVLYPEAQLLKAAGTLDADIMPVTLHQTSTGLFDFIEFQVKKSSDGTAVDPVSLTILFSIDLSDSVVAP